MNTDITKIPEERVLGGIVAMQQSTIREMLQELSERQIEFLKIRSMTSSDAAARHLLGHSRPEDDLRECRCGEHAPNWVDMRDRTVGDWKRDSVVFLDAYNVLLREPLMFASARMEQLAPAAVQTYSELLDREMKPEVRRAAAKDITEAVGIKATQGVPGSGDALRESFSFKMALNRYQRGMELSDEQRALLVTGGVDVNAPLLSSSSTEEAPRTERSLDGADVVVEQNADYLPD
jgi:hypothetical protein|tara:strand:+ start:1143 stop:1847 length:705 start_codon:yes stop_codon:yes gene_type:complete